ncbi:flagellar hook-length control protein FliK [Sporolactobacillus sp. THM19-2]|uniref:flagellar hook-length control protein FliK n=1 Tax=Sporolactobacillus sp. THM19-2 TaxID=2511171 RepID=UPI0010228679|nr:flagellar hook-length control protein FliK [Sporolactobacillus sp. THM19-2]RYL92953.1 flagellar hook-length control protein FliK [Sporolactobacillus sp. THM19-2]
MDSSQFRIENGGSFHKVVKKKKTKPVSQHPVNFMNVVQMVMVGHPSERPKKSGYAGRKNTSEAFSHMDIHSFQEKRPGSKFVHTDHTEQIAKKKMSPLVVDQSNPSVNRVSSEGIPGKSLPEKVSSLSDKKVKNGAQDQFFPVNQKSGCRADPDRQPVQTVAKEISQMPVGSGRHADKVHPFNTSNLSEKESGSHFSHDASTPRTQAKTPGHLLGTESADADQPTGHSETFEQSNPSVNRLMNEGILEKSLSEKVLSLHDKKIKNDAQDRFFPVNRKSGCRTDSDRQPVQTVAKEISQMPVGSGRHADKAHPFNTSNLSEKESGSHFSHDASALRTQTKTPRHLPGQISADPGQPTGHFDTRFSLLSALTQVGQEGKKRDSVSPELLPAAQKRVDGTLMNSGIVTASPRKGEGTQQDIRLLLHRNQAAAPVHLSKAAPPREAAKGSVPEASAFDQPVALRQVNRMTLWATFNENRPEAVTVSDFIGRQISEQLAKWLKQSSFQMTDRNNNRLTVTLYPEQLGQLTISVIQSEEGIIARLSTQTKFAKDMIESGLTRLADQLSRQGIPVSQIDVSRQWQTADSNDSKPWPDQHGYQSFQGNEHDSGEEDHRQENQQSAHIPENAEDKPAFIDWMTGGI